MKYQDSFSGIQDLINDKKGAVHSFFHTDWAAIINESLLPDTVLKASKVKNGLQDLINDVFSEAIEKNPHVHQVREYMLDFIFILNMYFLFKDKKKYNETAEFYEVLMDYIKVL
jgi:hypothetical protein